MFALIQVEENSGKEEENTTGGRENQRVIEGQRSWSW